MARAMVITGVGASTSVAPDASTLWKTLTQSPLRTGTKDHDVRDGCLSPTSDISGLFRARRWAEAAVAEALQQAGDPDLCDAGCTFSASKPLWENDTPLPPDRVNDFVRTRFGLGGESRNVVAACATGAASIALGASWIRDGLCEIVLAGSAEPAPHPLYEAGFARMGVLSDEPVMRPFDRRRRGFVFGEGAGAVVLESEAHAARRGARILARLSGWAMGSDTHGPVSFNSNGRRIADVLERSLRSAGLSEGEIDHVNAHGTATRLNDSLEFQALAQVFGGRLSEIGVAATKSVTGHLLGAAGSVECVLTVLALAHQRVPPTPTCEDPDPECRVRLARGEGEPRRIRHAASLSFGFGGPIGSLVISRC